MGCGNLSVHFVGSHFQNRIVGFDAITGLFEPGNHRAFHDTLAHFGHNHID